MIKRGWGGQSGDDDLKTHIVEKKLTRSKSRAYSIIFPAHRNCLAVTHLLTGCKLLCVKIRGGWSIFSCVLGTTPNNGSGRKHPFIALHASPTMVPWDPIYIFGHLAIWCWEVPNKSSREYLTDEAVCQSWRSVTVRYRGIHFGSESSITSSRQLRMIPWFTILHLVCSTTILQLLLLYRGEFFVWRAPNGSWPRIMCSQVGMLKFLEPWREMP